MIKICPKCEIPKDRSEYQKQKATKDGLQHACKQCRAIAKKEYTVDNKDKITKSSYEYYHKNKENRQQWYQKNKEERKNYDKKYNQTPKGKASNRNNSHKRRLTKSEGTATNEYIAKIWQEATHCPIFGICLTDEPGFPNSKHIDHMIPLSRGGGHHNDNLWVVSARYNLTKHNSIDDICVVDVNDEV